MSFAIAIDGPAASGKGTLARALAARYGFAHLDTGLLYRAVGAQVLEGADALKSAQSLEADMLDDARLRSADVAQAASRVAAMPDVRKALLDFQRAFARRSGGAVLDGRDIGTVICPEAHVKFFVTASAEERARRRLAELTANGSETDFATVLKDIQQRDARDSGRADAPLKPADDAIHLDTTQMAIEVAFDHAVAAVDAALERGAPG